MDRRNIIRLGAATAASTALSNVATAQDRASDSAHDIDTAASERRGLLDGPLVNQAQAQAIMERRGLQGLIALHPINVFYLTNTVPVVTKMNFDFPAMATYPRNPEQPPFLIASAMQTLDIANKSRWTPDIMAYSGPANIEDYRGESALAATVQPLAAPFGFTFSAEDRLTVIERAWKQASIGIEMSPTIEWALAKALEESGITSGRVAIDDTRIAGLLNRIGQATDIEFVDGANVFREIRHVKSAREIAIMRVSAKANAEATIATGGRLEVGMDHAAIEQVFLEEAAIRGNIPVFMLAGFALGGLADGEIRPDRPFLIDAVSQFHGYQGDFARTFAFEELNDRTRKIVAAQAVAREAVFEAIEPGLKFSEIRAIGKEAFRKAGGGIADAFIVNPHSVGLEHSDQPGSTADPWRSPLDIELKTGMTITVDLPYLEVGALSGHHEDLIEITDNGFRKLTDDYPDVIEIG